MGGVVEIVVHVGGGTYVAGWAYRAHATRSHKVGNLVLVLPKLGRHGGDLDQ
jgi:hypothetical protein